MPFLYRSAPLPVLPLFVNVSIIISNFVPGIPDKPDMAETYYSQFDDEFEEEDQDEILNEDEEEKVQQILEALNREVEEEYENEEDDDDDDENEGTLLATVMAGGGGGSKKKSSQVAAGEGEDEVGDLINCMQNALDRSDTSKFTILSVCVKNVAVYVHNYNFCMDLTLLLKLFTFNMKYTSN